MTKIRVSAANLVRIDLDGKILVAFNKRRLKAGNKVYTPFGGALEFYEESRSFLDSLEVQYEKGRDLRFIISDEYLPNFEDWFRKQQGRETSPYRELSEELIDEEGALEELPESAVNLEYLTTTTQRAPTDRPGQEGMDTQRFFEVYRATFTPEYEELLRQALAQPGTHLALVSEDEILNGYTETGIKIASNCIPLVYKE